MPRILVVNGETYIRANTVSREEFAASEFARTVIDIAAANATIRPIEITGRSRTPRLSPIRAACIAVMREQGNMTWDDIAEAMRRDRSTVLTCHEKHAGTVRARRWIKLILERLKLKEEEEG